MVRVGLRTGSIGGAPGGRRPRLRVALIAAILSGPMALGACGQRGPLVLPTPPAEPPPRVRAPTSGVVVLPPAGDASRAAPASTPPTDASDPASSRAY